MAYKAKGENYVNRIRTSFNEQDVMQTIGEQLVKVEQNTNHFKQVHIMYFRPQVKQN